MKITNYLLLLFCISANHSLAQNEIKYSNYKNKSIVWLDHSALIIDHTSKNIKELYQEVNKEGYRTEMGYISEEKVKQLKYSDPESYDYYKNSGDHYAEKLNYHMLSVVGPYISFKHDYYYEGGAHPAYGIEFKNYNMETESEISLLDIFEEIDILNALLNDKFIQQFLSKNDPKSLDELFHHLYFEDLNFGKHMLKHFSFHHIKDNKVAIRIGVSHGNEMARGTFAEVGIYLPIPVELKDAFTKAVNEKTLMKDMVVN